MTIKDLQTIITTYRRATEQVTRLNDEFGLDLWSKDQGFLPDYELVIYDLTKALFKDCADTFWDYIFEQSDIDFDELCELLEIEDYVPQQEATLDEVFDWLDHDNQHYLWNQVDDVFTEIREHFVREGKTVNPAHVLDWIEKEIV